MKPKIVVVEAKYAQNLGLIARVLKNFGLKELVLVNPFADKNSVEAISRASHARDVLKKAKIVSSIKKALIGADYAVATTARISKNDSINRQAISLKQFVQKFSHSKKSFAFLFGNEERGLTNKQLQECDLIVSIPSSKAYPVLNISHAITIVCYELFQPSSKQLFKEAGKKKRKLLEKQLLALLETGGIKSPESMKKSIKAFLNRSMLSEKEANALLSLLKAR